MRYFQDQLAGALGHRLTSTAGAFGQMVNRMVWDIAPPLVSFLGALLLFAGLDGGMTCGAGGLRGATTTVAALSPTGCTVAAITTPTPSAPASRAAS